MCLGKEVMVQNHLVVDVDVHRVWKEQLTLAFCCLNNVILQLNLLCLTTLKILQFVGVPNLVVVGDDKTELQESPQRFQALYAVV